MNFKDYIRVIEDFPKPGISFKDITTLLKNGPLYHQALNRIIEETRAWQPDLVVGPEARGFLVAAPVAYALEIGFVPVRKSGKLPGKVVSETYALEYGFDTLEVHSEAIQRGQRVVSLDDLLATGGTTAATAKLINKIGAEVVGMSFMIELTFLEGRKKCGDIPIFSLMQY